MKSVMIGFTTLSDLFLVLNEGLDFGIQVIMCHESKTQSSVPPQNIRYLC